jgi:hypothetical protein
LVVDTAATAIAAADDGNDDKEDGAKGDVVGGRVVAAGAAGIPLDLLPDSGIAASVGVGGKGGFIIRLEVNMIE